jgi:23S rRNA (uracil1939-C5)-methyltransferase
MINEIKQEKFNFVKRIFELQSETAQSSDLNIVESTLKNGYRNKMEYPFYALEDNTLTIAEYRKGTKRGLIPGVGSPLAASAINECALSIVKYLNENNVKKSQLKGIQMRYSKYEDKVTAIIFVKDREFKINKSIFEINQKIKNLIVYYSTPKSPAYVMTEKLYSEGEEIMYEKVSNKVFSFPFDGFFQVNIELFEKVIEEVEEYLKSKDTKKKRLVDLYCGVGVIGILLSKYAEEIVGVESTKSAQSFAETNAKNNNVKTYQFLSTNSENIVNEVLKQDDIIVIDPPRAGCHKNVIEAILKVKPEIIIYLSCNPETQYRDLQLLINHYTIKKMKAFDFFPNTNHLEDLVILEKKQV